MASEIKEKGCLCGSDLLLTNINTVSGGRILIYNCDDINCKTVSIFKYEKKSYKHIKLEVKKNA